MYNLLSGIDRLQVTRRWPAIKSRHPSRNTNNNCTTRTYTTNTDCNCTKSGLKPFAKTLLTINFNHPFYDNIPLLREYYEPIFDNIIFCGPESNTKYNIIVIEGTKGHFGYKCIAEGIRKYPEYSGYLYVNDDMVVNWWTMFKQPRDRIWYGKDIINAAGANMDKPAPCCWQWWKTANALENCKISFDALKEKLASYDGVNYTKIFFDNTNGERLCLRAWSDFMYVPYRLSQVYLKLADEFYKNKVFLETAVSTILTILDKKRNRVNLDGMYLPDTFGDKDFQDGIDFVKSYDIDRTFYHPVKLSVKGAALNIFKNVIMKYSRLSLNSLGCLERDIELS